MIAAALIGGAALAAAGLFKFSRAQNQFTVVTGTALRLESQLITGLQDGENYRGDMSKVMRDNKKPEGLAILSPEKIAIARVGSTLTLDVNGRPCVGPACAITSKFDIKCFVGICRAAYQIEMNPAVLKTSVAPLGAPSWPPTPADYTQLIGYDLYRDGEESAKCQAGELFVAGLNRGNGAVDCVRAPSRKLASNQIAKSVAFDTTTGALEFNTQNIRPLVCPAKYVAQSVRPSSLEKTPEGTCVYRYRKELPWMEPWPTGATSVSGNFCPKEDYEAVPTGACTVRITKTTPGLCYKKCTNDGGTSSYECNYNVDPDTSHRIVQNVSGPNVSCQMIRTGTQKCGANFEAEVLWSGTCRITVPETLPGGG